MPLKLSHLNPCSLESSSADSWVTRCPGRSPEPDNRRAGFGFCFSDGLPCDPGKTFDLSVLVATGWSPRDPFA